MPGQRDRADPCDKSVGEPTQEGVSMGELALPLPALTLGELVGGVGEELTLVVWAQENPTFIIESGYLQYQMLL